MTDLDSGFRAALLVVLFQALRQRDPAAVGNALLGLLATAAPSALERTWGVRLRDWQRAYVHGSILAHCVGMLGPYDDQDRFPWWDHVTHTASASILAGVCHVWARRGGRDPTRTVLSAITVAGLAWEVLEYAVHWVSRRLGLEPLLVTYGTEDTLVDLAFDLVGAALVLVFGDTALANLVEQDE